MADDQKSETPPVIPATPAAGDTPPAKAEGDGNPLFAALFASAPKPSDKEKEPAPPPKRGKSLSEVMSETDAAAKKDDKTGDPKPGEKKEEASGDKKVDPAAAAKPAPVKLSRRAKKEEPAPAPVAAAVVPAPVAKPAPTTEEEFEKTLEPEEKEQLDMLRYAEAKMGEKYKGAPAKMLAFLQKHAKFIDAKKAEDPEYDFSDSNPEYRAWKKANMPASITSGERWQIMKAQIKDETKAETQTAIASVRSEQERKELMPIIKREGDKFFEEVTAYAMPEELKSLLAEKGVAEAKKLYPDEYQIIEEMSDGFTKGAEEFLAIHKGAARYDPSNQRHVDLDRFIAFQCDDFSARGGEHRMKDGKSFVTRAQFGTLPAGQRAKHWTFDENDVLALIKESAKLAIDGRIKEFREKEKVREDARAARKGTTKPAEPKPDESAGKVRPAPTSSGNGKEEAAPANPVFSALGM